MQTKLNSTIKFAKVSVGYMKKHRTLTKIKETWRIRLNQEYRNKIAKRIELGLDQENTIEKEKYLQLREQIKPLQDKTWEFNV